MTVKRTENKRNIILLDDGHRTSGIFQFFESLPEHIMPIQKSEPPYMPVASGYGYQGVMLLDKKLDRVQCHMCGRWYKCLSAHIKIHNVNHIEYKDKFGLYRKEPLMSLSTLYKFRVTNKQISRENLSTGHKFDDGEFERKRKSNFGSHKMQFKNRYGTCDAQLKFRLDKAIEKYGRIPTTDEEKVLYTAFRRRFGGWREGLLFYKIKT